MASVPTPTLAGAGGFGQLEGMVTAAEIRDGDSLERWLLAQMNDNAVTLAQRAACRVLPMLGMFMGHDLAKGNDLTALPILRANLSLGVACKSASQDVAAAVGLAAAWASEATAAVSSASPSQETATAAASSASIAAAGFASVPAVSGIRHAASASANATHSFAGAAAADQIWEQVREDARLIEAGEDPLAVRLWSIPEPEWFSLADSAMRANWRAKDPEHWAFWTRWWDGVLSGEQVEWELQRQVAVIPSDVWEQGPVAVAARIALIEEKVRLRREVAELKAQFTEAKARIAPVQQRGHNNPPELIDPSGAIRREITVVWEALEDAEQELTKSDPDPSLLAKIGNVLLKASVSLAKYCGGLADTALKKGAEELGTAGTKWAIRGGVVLFASQSEGVQSFAKALIEFAKALAQSGAG